MLQCATYRLTAAAWFSSFLENAFVSRPKRRHAMRTLKFARSTWDVLFDGDRLRVSAYVNAKGAKRLLKRLQANMALLEDDGEDEGEE